MTKLLTALLAAGVLAGCASTRLDEAPVTTAAATAPASSSTATGPQGQSQVAPVTAGRSAADAAGPADAARVIYFEYDSATIKPEFQPVLGTHANFLTRHRDRKLTVGGHTDERGGREYNLALGQQRADAVRQALRLLGVPDTQVETVSFGEEKPVSEGHTEASWAGNRRAELAYR
jgi:peptidoglycan-associated lipoprotein